MKYLTKRGLDGLKAYQYKASGYTYLDNLHRPFLDWAALQLPLWLAPNLITLMGTMALVASYLTSAYYTPDFVGDAPRWTYLLSAFAVVFYTILDCLDGKHARRTNTSSPLGQLFDHGCDALSVNLLLANIACSLSIGCSWAHALGNLGVMFTWILAQWEEYHTSVMKYGNQYYGVLECNYTLAAVHMATFILGPAFWRDPATNYLPIPALQGWMMNDAIIILMICVGFYQATTNIRNVWAYQTSSMPAQERGHKQLAKGAAAAHFVIIVTLLVLGCIWLWRPCEELYLCRAQNAGFGIAYALMASQLIMAHMCKEPFQAPLWAIVCLALGNLNKVLGLYDPLTVTLALDAALLAGYLHYVLVVIGQICEHLDIYCLTIKRKPAADAE